METDIEGDVCDLTATLEPLEDPIVSSEWRLAMDTEVKDKLEVDFTTVSSVYDLSAELEATIDGSKWRLAMETKDLCTAIAADFSERFDFEHMCTSPRVVDMRIADAYSSTDYKIGSASDATFEDVGLLNNKNIK